MSMSIKIEGLDAALVNLRGVEKKMFQKAGKQALKAAGTVLVKALRENMSITDHTQASLRALGHPYARRHGAIRIHQQRPYVIHKQSGLMKSKITRKSKGSGKKIRYQVGFNYGAVPYAKYVIQGTRVMLPRNTIYLTSQQPEIRKEMMKAVVRVLGKELRTGAGVRFG
jgi:hypothetical protein